MAGMSSLHPSLTAYVPPELVPPSLASSEAAWELWCQCKTGLEPIAAHSEGGWVGITMKNVIHALHVEALGFLCCEPWTDPIGCSAFLFRGAELVQVVEQAERVIAEATARPADFEEWLMDWSRGDIEAAVADAAITATPTIDIGNDPRSLFSYLKTLAHYGHHASAQGGALLYMHWNS